MIIFGTDIDCVQNIVEIPLNLYVCFEENLQQLKSIRWGDDIMVRSGDSHMYRTEGVSVYMLELTIRFVSFLKSLEMNMNSKTI